MAKVKEIRPGVYQFQCPGCGDTHEITTGGPFWSFNGDLDKPTFNPSILVTSGHYMKGHKGDSCWCTYNAENPGKEHPFTCYLCHSFVTEGHIEFLNDCSHKLGGHTVELPDIV